MEYGGGFATRAPPPGRGLNMASLPPVKCYRCGGPNHMARYVQSIYSFPDRARRPGADWLRRVVPVTAWHRLTRSWKT